VLAKQFHFLAVLLNINRERGNVPVLKISSIEGKEFKWHPDGAVEFASPSYVSVKNENMTRISLTAPNLKYAKKMITGIVKAHPQLDKKAIEEKLRVVSMPAPTLTASLEFGGEDGGRSLVKTMLAYACSIGIDPTTCVEALDYLRKAKDVQGCFGYYYDNDLIQQRNELPIALHCLAIKADPRNGLVLGYLEYFGSVRTVMCLSKSYQGNFLKATYAIDPITGEEIADVGVSLNFNEQDIQDIYNYKKLPQDKQEAAYSRVIAYASKKKHHDRLFNIAHKKALDDCGIASFEKMTDELLPCYFSSLTAKLAEELISTSPRCASFLFADFIL
jgi:hypothetical protein